MKTKQEDSLIKPSIDELLTKVENKYVLSLLCAKRARELFDGDETLIDEYHINNVTTAIHEIDQGKVQYTKLEDPPQGMIPDSEESVQGITEKEFVEDSANSQPIQANCEEVQIEE